MMPDSATDWQDLHEKVAEAKKPILSAYAKAVAPAKRRHDDDLARIDREFSEKMQGAKARLSSAQREFKETRWTLQRWRDATKAAIEREFRNEKGPALEERNRLLRPIKEWDAAEWARIRDEDAKKGSTP